MGQLPHGVHLQHLDAGDPQKEQLKLLTRPGHAAKHPQALPQHARNLLEPQRAAALLLHGTPAPSQDPQAGAWGLGDPAAGAGNGSGTWVRASCGK